MTRWCPAPWSASQRTKDTPTNKTWQPTKDTHENALHLDLCGIYKKKKKTRIQTMWKHKRQMPEKKKNTHAWWRRQKTRIQMTRTQTNDTRSRDTHTIYTHTNEKRPTKETYKRDLCMRKETYNWAYEREVFICLIKYVTLRHKLGVHMKSDSQKRPTKETYTKDQQKRPVYVKRDL